MSKKKKNRNAHYINIPVVSPTMEALHEQIISLIDAITFNEVGLMYVYRTVSRMIQEFEDAPYVGHALYFVRNCAQTGNMDGVKSMLVKIHRHFKRGELMMFKRLLNKDSDVGTLGYLPLDMRHHIVSLHSL